VSEPQCDGVIWPPKPNVARRQSPAIAAVTSVRTLGNAAEGESLSRSILPVATSCRSNGDRSIERDMRTALEAKADVWSLDELQQKRRELLKEYAPLAAKFKGGASAGTDAARKRHRALVAKRILVEMERLGGEARPGGVIEEFKAPSETALERMANADTEHIAYCDKLEADYTRFIVLENDIQEINEKIRSREVELYAYNAEIRMSR
jgi:hypothetical protein